MAIVKWRGRRRRLRTTEDNLFAASVMWQFNIFFLIKATAVTALCCLPMAYNPESGFVWTAFLLPVSLGCLTATQVGRRGPFEFKFNELPGPVVEIYTTGGRQHQWQTRSRILGAGACLSIVFGFPALHSVDPEPPLLWLPVVVSFAVGAVVAVGGSARRTVLPAERQFVTDYLLFDRLCWWRRRWQVRAGDFLAVCSTSQPQAAPTPESQSWRALYVCRLRRRWMIGFSTVTMDRIAPDMESAAHRVARLVDLPYEGYCK